MPNDDDVDYARQLIRRSVWSGFEDAEALETIIGDLMLEDPGHDVNALRAYAATEVARKAAEEKTWTQPTDCDRLDAVFTAIEHEGVLGLHNAGYTMTDGHAEAAEALAKMPNGQFFGYCFYHGQDVERAIDGGPLFIAFGHVDGEVPDRHLVGRMVETALGAAGFITRWDGETNQRIEIKPFIWQRRGGNV